MLPIELPEVDDYSPRTFESDDASSEPEPPLGRATEWVEVELDLGDGVKKYRRETNTMPNWAGSCWYYLRYLDPANSDALVDPANEAYWVGPRDEAVPGAPPVPVTRVASTSTSAVSSTPCCTCSTPASGTRCSSTSVT